MQNRATDQNFSPGEATSPGFFLEASPVGESEGGSSADLKLSEQEHFLCYSEPENARSFKFCMLSYTIET